MKKTANIPAVPSIRDVFLNPGFIAAAATPFLAVAASQVDKTLDRMRQSRERNQGFSSMIDMHPELRSHRHPELVANVYNSLARANPYLASDPFVAGSMVKNVVGAHDHINPEEAHRTMGEAFGKALEQRHALGIRDGGPGLVAKAVESAGEGFSTSYRDMKSKLDQRAESDYQFARSENSFKNQQAQKDREQRYRELMEANSEIERNADRASRRATAMQQGFTRLTGVGLDEDSKPRGATARTRQYLNRAADEAVRSGLGRPRDKGPRER